MHAKIYISRMDRQPITLSKSALKVLVTFNQLAKDMSRMDGIGLERDSELGGSPTKTLKCNCSLE